MAHPHLFTAHVLINLTGPYVQFKPVSVQKRNLALRLQNLINYLIS